MKHQATTLGDRERERERAEEERSKIVRYESAVELKIMQAQRDIAYNFCDRNAKLEKEKPAGFSRCTCLGHKVAHLIEERGGESSAVKATVAQCNHVYLCQHLGHAESEYRSGGIGGHLDGTSVRRAEAVAL